MTDIMTLEKPVLSMRIDMDDLIRQMESCPQNEHQSVLQHGQSVWAHYKVLMGHLKNKDPLPDWWRVPEWASQISHMAYDDEIMAKYAEFHDCGKPYCRTIDDQGRQHFPDHANMSECVWRAAGGTDIAARLMGMDMDAHLLSNETIPEFAARPEAPSLLLMAIAEVHSNAMMFGGTDSDSFKIKAKKLSKRGGQAVKMILAN